MPQLRWTMHQAPFRINFSDPTILDLERNQWDKSLNVVTVDKEGEDQWIWLVISAPDEVPSDGEGLFIPAAHPMHLHGHDFALLKQSTTRWNASETELNCNGTGITCNNPPRRDVALLPASGYLIIAFKADNPGRFFCLCNCISILTNLLKVRGSFIVTLPSMPPLVLLCRLSKTST